VLRRKVRVYIRVGSKKFPVVFQLEVKNICRRPTRPENECLPRKAGPNFVPKGWSDKGPQKTPCIKNSGPREEVIWALLGPLCAGPVAGSHLCYTLHQRSEKYIACFGSAANTSKSQQIDACKPNVGYRALNPCFTPRIATRSRTPK